MDEFFPVARVTIAPGWITVDVMFIKIADSVCMCLGVCQYVSPFSVSFLSCFSVCVCVIVGAVYLQEDLLKLSLFQLACS